MLEKKRHPGIVLSNIALFFVCILLYGSTEIDLSIMNAYPFVLLALLAAYSVFAEISFAAAAGFISGAFIDSVSGGGHCFNTIVFMFLAVSVCLLANNVFNKNLKAVITLCFLSAVAYFFLYWIAFIAFSLNTDENTNFLLRYAIPSAVYTTFFVISFSFLYKFFNQKRNSD